MAFMFGDSLQNHGVSEVSLRRKWSNTSVQTNQTMSTTGGPFSDAYIDLTSSGAELKGRTKGDFDATANKIHAAFWFRKANASVVNSHILTFADNSGGGIQGFSVGIDASDQVYLRDWSANFNSGNVRVTSTGVVTTSWKLIEVALLADNVSGSAQIWIDGVDEGTFSGDTILNGTPGTNLIDTVMIRGRTSGQGGAHFSHVLCWDESGTDFAYTTVGSSMRARKVVPTAAGATTQFTPSAGSNWQNVDDTPSNDATDYNESTTSGHVDTFVHGGFPAPSGFYRGAQVTVVGECQTVGNSGLVRPILRSGGVNHNGGSKDVTVYEHFDHFWGKDPQDSADWTEAKGDAAEPGYELVS